MLPWNILSRKIGLRIIAGGLFRELPVKVGFAESDNEVSGVAGPNDDLAQVSVTVSSRCYLVCFYDAAVQSDTVGAFVSLLLNIDGSDTQTYMASRIDVAYPNGYTHIGVNAVVEVEAGPHTIKGRFYSNAGTAYVNRRTLVVLAIPK